MEQLDRPCTTDEVAATPQEQVVRVTKVANGFMVRVGCKTFVAYTWSEVSDGLTMYWADPKAAEKRYVTNK